jgi:hypothetical protein
MDAPGAEPFLRETEAVAFLAEEVRRRDVHVVVSDVGVPTVREPDGRDQFKAS